MWFVVAQLVCGVHVARAADAPSEKTSTDTSGLWLGAYTKYRISDKFDYYGEYHLRRRYDVAREMAQIYLRFGINYRATEKAQFTGGIVTPLYWSSPDRAPDEAVMVPQFRLWQQVLLAQEFGRLRLYHQYRTEQRWARAYAEGSPFLLTYRWRYKLQFYIPLNHATMAERTWFIALYEEVFLQTGPSVLYNVFEDNRAYVGLGRIVDKNVQVQLGYMWTFRHAGSPYAYENRHIIRLSFMHNLDLRQLGGGR